MTCYRALLRWSARCGDAPLRVNKEHLQEVCPALSHASYYLMPDSGGLRSIIQWQFRRKDNSLSEAEEPVVQAFAALKLLNSQYEPRLQMLEDLRMSHKDRHGIDFHIGQVVQHKQRGYSAVVTGWDRVCEDIGALQDPNVNLTQPFYSLVIDMDSCRGGREERHTYEYAGQDELVLMTNAPQISNRRIYEFFDGYSMQLGRYIPKKELQWEYPDDYKTEDIQPCHKLGQKSARKSQSTSGSGKQTCKAKARKKDKSSGGYGGMHGKAAKSETNVVTDCPASPKCAKNEQGSDCHGKKPAVVEEHDNIS